MDKNDWNEEDRQQFLQMREALQRKYKTQKELDEALNEWWAQSKYRPMSPVTFIVGLLLGGLVIYGIIRLIP